MTNIEKSINTMIGNAFEEGTIIGCEVEISDIHRFKETLSFIKYYVAKMKILSSRSGDVIEYRFGVPKDIEFDEFIYNGSKLTLFKNKVRLASCMIYKF